MKILQSSKSKTRDLARPRAQLAQELKQFKSILDPGIYDASAKRTSSPEAIDKGGSRVVDFYNGRSVLITGATGFIGKMVIEKLIRTCIGLRTIFVLIKPKWNKQPEERLDELLTAPLFDTVRGDGLLDRVVLIEGDVTKPDFGMSFENLSRVINEVSVVIHSAATVKFDEPLKQSVAINIGGVKNMIDLCHKLPQLAAVVHVSTAYANCNQQSVDEHIYPVEMDPERLIKMAKWLDQDTLQELRGRLLGPHPNTYTYTKALGEWLVFKCARDLPIVMCRPSIVIASWREPFRGWIDNINGPTGVLVGAGKGLFRSMLCDPERLADIVPVDVVANQIVSLGWFASIHHSHKINATSYRPPKQQVTNNSTSRRTKDDSEDAQCTIDTSGKSKDLRATSPGEEAYLEVGPCEVGSEFLLKSATGSVKGRLTGREAVVASKRAHPQLKFNQEQSEQEQRLMQFRHGTKTKLVQKGLPVEIADVPVFHCCSGVANPITWGKLQTMVVAHHYKYPSITTYRYPCEGFTTNRYLDKFYRITLHYFPAYVLDFVTKLIGGKPLLAKIFRKFDTMAAVLERFVLNEWTFADDNRLTMIRDFMNEKDRQLFDFDISKLNWNECVEGYVLGARKFLLKEPLDNVAKARRNLKLTYIRNLILQLVLVVLVVYTLQAQIISKQDRLDR